jgi:hypothetical protein
MREIFPKASQILEGEFHYRSRGGIRPDPEFGQQTMADNSGFMPTPPAMAHAEADRIVCPTPFRRNLSCSLNRAVIIHEGMIPTDCQAGRTLWVAGEGSWMGPHPSSPSSIEPSSRCAASMS